MPERHAPNAKKSNVPQSYEGSWKHLTRLSHKASQREAGEARGYKVSEALVRGGVLEQYGEHGKQGQRSRHGFVGPCSRRPVRKAG
jgi:hypothetical protein